ncbi:MAG: F420-0:Gamma-glutamyl ligase [Elainellaceae cyanobacterium]
MIASLGIGLGALAALIVVGGGAVEWQYRRRPGNQLDLTEGEWNLDIRSPERYLLTGDLELINRTQRLEIMVPHVDAEVTLLSGGSLDHVNCRPRVAPRHPDAAARPDGYWFGYIVKIGKTTHIDITLDIQGEDLDELRAAWIRVHYLTYGPEGRIPKMRHIIVPLRFPQAEDSHRWRPTADADILPVKTHLLTHLDDPVSVIKRYVVPHAQPGDIVTLGETPVAIMQGRWRHPADIKPGWVAKRLCYYFMPTSSLATACGMQALIDVVGAARVVTAFIIGAIAKKLLRIPGVFYRLAGEQARLIDDVTGTLPPYDQFIVLGPDHPLQVVNQIQQETGLSAAIVDVNDLKAVKILAATSDLSLSFLEQALITNPAGNADEQTPVVLIRPTETAIHPGPI